MSFINSYQKKLSRAFLVLFSALSMSAAASASEGAFFVDMLVLKEGKTTTDANAYFDKIEPVVQKHGLRRIMPGLNVVKNMKGSFKADLVNIWMVTNAKTTFDGIFNDPEYLKHIQQRDSTFDMKNANMMMLQPF